MENPRPLQIILDAFSAPVSDEISQLLTSFQPHPIPKGRVLIGRGQVSSVLYFLERGVMRTYYTRGSEDITSLLITDGGIVCIAASFFDQAPSEETLETLEDCIVYSLPYDTYRKLAAADHHIAILTIQLLEQHLIGFGDRVKIFKYLTVDERISHYISHPSSVFRRIPDHYIATYLGTTSATFSRSLKNILRKKE